MSNYNPWADESDDEIEDKKIFESVRDNIIFLIDCNEQMLEPVEVDDESSSSSSPPLLLPLRILRPILSLVFPLH
jgi:hypothetical protein